MAGKKKTSINVRAVAISGKAKSGKIAYAKTRVRAK